MTTDGKGVSGPHVTLPLKNSSVAPVDSINIMHTGIQAVLSIFIIHALAPYPIYSSSSTLHLLLPNRATRTCLSPYLHALHMLHPAPVMLLFQYSQSTFFKNLRLIPNDISSMRLFLILPTCPFPPNCPIFNVSPLNSKVVYTSCLAFNLCFVPCTCLIASIHAPGRCN